MTGFLRLTAEDCHHSARLGHLDFATSNGSLFVTIPNSISGLQREVAIHQQHFSQTIRRARTWSQSSVRPRPSSRPPRFQKHIAKGSTRTIGCWKDDIWT